MYFYVDESGHTGANLFDPNQPVLYYGVLSSHVNIDVLVEPKLAALRKTLGVDRLHAGELGNAGLAVISNDIERIQKKYDIRFDVYRIAKPDHAVISFFDQVFDHGMNPAVTWSGYWTPLRYALLLKVASLFDEEAAYAAWAARIDVNDARAEQSLVGICKALRGRVGDLPDARSRQLISDSLTWAAHNPEKIRYNVKSKKDILQITPNIIGFQSVMHGIAHRLINHRKEASKIVVDQQSQFNKAQKTLADFFASARDIPGHSGPGLPEVTFKGMPTIPITFSAGTASAGLELVDLNLWIFKRLIEGKDLAHETQGIVAHQIGRGRTDEVSLNAIANRWEKWFEKLPDPTGKQLEKARELIAFDENRRLAAISGTEGFPDLTSNENGGDAEEGD